MTKPRIHFSPEKNWMNDPNGTICLNGTYHLFHQYNPDGCEWGNIQWAHASGQNLIDWRRHGCKLVPDASIGERYCFSGCSVRTPKGCKCFYTSIGFEKDAAQHHAKQLICDADTAFETITRNGYAVTDSVHPFPVSEWRDPFVFAFGGKWFMVLAGIRGKTSCIFLYEAQDEDLNHWQYIAPLYTIDTEQDMFECPNVAVFGNQIVLLYSLVKENVVKYVCGTFDGKKLTVSGEGYIDHGANCYYASNLARRDDGAYILFAWQKESLIGSASPDGTYSGCLAIPRIMMLDGNRVTFRFADALYDLRERELSTEREDARLKIAGTSERTLLSFDLQKNTEIAIRKNEKERVTLAFRNGFLRILRSSLCTNADERELTAPLPAGKTRVQILSDGTITEIMLGDRTAVSFRFYNQEPIECILEADADTIENLSAYELRSARIQ